MRNRMARVCLIVLLTIINLGVASRPARAAVADLSSEMNLSNSSTKQLNILEKDLFKKAFPMFDSVVPESVMTMRVIKGYGEISSYFGMRMHPIYHHEIFHSGIDIKAKKGTEVASLLDGKIIFAGRMGGYGKVVVIEHTLGWTTCYAHLSDFVVTAGDYVFSGDVVGKVGSTGVSSGNHLHFEIRYLASAVDPLKYLKTHL